MITKLEEVSKIEIVGQFKHVQVKVDTVIVEDGLELSRSSHRYVVSPGDDYSTLPADVQTACAAYHTQEVIDTYQAHMAAQE